MKVVDGDGGGGGGGDDGDGDGGGEMFSKILFSFLLISMTTLTSFFVIS